MTILTREDVARYCLILGDEHVYSMISPISFTARLGGENTEKITCSRFAAIMAFDIEMRGIRSECWLTIVTTLSEHFFLTVSLRLLLA